MSATLEQPKIITRYDYAAQAEVAPGVSFDAKKDKSLTNQADMESADINKIMARYEKTGVLIDTLGIERKPMYGDFSEVKDYHTSLAAIRRTEAAFGLLPAAIRNRFQNDPQALINFLEDPKNDKEAVELGLKDADVLKTAFADDGKTRITPEERALYDAEKAKKAAAAAAAAASATGGGAGAPNSGTMGNT